MKKIMLDTNILISAFVFGGRIREFIGLLVKDEYELYVSDYVDSEFKEKIYLKWADKAENALKSYESFDFIRCESTNQILGILRDKKDIPVLSDAIYHDVDILLTGDRDFLESEIDEPLILSPAILAEYLEIF